VLVALTTFSLAALLLVLLPGPDTIVIVRSIVRGGRRRGLAALLGIQSGLVVWILAATFGLVALLKASEIGFVVLRVVGAAYLIWLGVQSFRSRGGTDPAAAAAEGRGLAGTGYRAGFLSNLFNPKVGVFFVTFLPSFVPSGYPVGPTLLLFGALFVTINVAWQLPLVLLAARVTALFARARVRRRLELLTGTVLVAFGLRLAVEG
jgi:threonine/homoserine/homoserine lactone efflux protein